MSAKTHRALRFEELELRQLLAADLQALETQGGSGFLDSQSTPVAEVAQAAGESTDSAAAIAQASQANAWASTRGLYVFNVGAYQGDWAPKEWTLSQWENWLDTMQFLNFNHLQLPRAPWSERPAETQFETDKEDLWVSILQEAKSRGMTTSIIFSTTFHGDLQQPWRILSPGNSPADPNWQTLVSDYNYWATRYGQWVDEWVMGVEDPGGSPSSAGISWAFETPSPLGDPSNVSELVSLELEMLAAAQSVNPSSTVVAETWGLHWWGLSPGYSSHLNEFLGNENRLPASVPLSTHGNDDAVTDALQATGRDVDAWPFFLIDHEFPSGHTRLYFNWTRNYLQQIQNQGIDDVVAHISHPMEQLPSLYVYSRLLEDTQLNKQTLLEEFSSFLVSDTSDQVSLANAINNLSLYWESVSGIATWEAANLQPVEATAPFAPLYNATQLGYLDAALANITLVDTPRAVSQIPMQISAEAWVAMLRDQIQFLHDAANVGDLVTESATHLNNNYSTIAALDQPLTREQAQTIVTDYLNAGAAGSLQEMEDYLSQFWTATTGLNHPLGIIYDFLLQNVPADTAGLAAISGDYLEYDAPSHSLLLKQLEGLTEETDGSFSYLQSSNWTTETNPAYSGGTAMVTSAANNDVNIIFAGSGISLIHSLWDQGANVSWSIDGGAGGSGIVNMYSANRQDQVETQLASGLDPTLHILNIKKTFGGGSVLVDAVKVESPGGDITGDYDNDGVVGPADRQVWETSYGTSVPAGTGADGNGDGRVNGQDFLLWQRNLGSTEGDGGLRLRRESDRDLFTFSGDWFETTEGTPGGGNWHYTLDASATVSIPFEGTAVGITATTRGDYGDISWSIDGGAGGSGTVSLNDVNNTFRKQFILSTTLSDGPHTLELSKASGFLVNIDSVDSVVGATSAPPPPPVPTRFEAESTGAVKDKNDAVGYDSINGVVGRAADAAASNGEVLFTLGTDRKMKVIFAGTGIDLVAPQTSDGALFSWTLDEGAQTGTGTTIGAGGPQTSIPIVSGLPNGLHTLEIEKTFPSSSEDFVLRVDAFDVHDSADRTRYEQDDPAISYSPGLWNTSDSGGDAAQEASGGTFGWTIVDGATATLNFDGTGVAAIIASRIDSRVFNYDIDGGAVTGTIDTAAAAVGVGSGIWHRYPYLLANDLSDGPHTLTMTATTGSVGGDFIGFLDAIDVFKPSFVLATALEEESFSSAVAPVNSVEATEAQADEALVVLPANTWLPTPFGRRSRLQDTFAPAQLEKHLAAVDSAMAIEHPGQRVLSLQHLQFVSSDTNEMESASYEAREARLAQQEIESREILDIALRSLF